MKRLLLGTLVLLLGLACLSLATSAAAQDKDKAKDKKEAPIVPPRKGESETFKLFNGKDLDGWEGYDEYWSVKDGEIVGKNKDGVEFSTYLLTKKKFSDFRLKAAVKLAQSEMHSGICFWGSFGPEVVPEKLRNEKSKVKYTYGGHLVMFPSGWGMYDLYGGPNKTGVGLPVDSGPAKKVGKQHDWNDLEILAQGNRVRVAVNGKQVVDFRDLQPDRIKEAPIGLQLHSNKEQQEVRFKDITVETFPKEDKLLTVKE